MKVFYDNQQLRQLLDDFASLTRVRITVFDRNRQGVLSRPDVADNFCTLARRHEPIRHRCIECDNQGFSKAESLERPYIYTCHLGLYEAVMPIYHEKQITGYIMIGQVLNAKSTIHPLQAVCRLVSIDRQEYKKLDHASNNIRVMNDAEIQSAVNLMHACSMYIYLQHIQRVEHTPLAEQIHSYIENHYQDKVTSDQLCTELKIGRTTLYHAIKNEYNMSLTELINQTRVNKACELLSTSDDRIMMIADQCGYADYNYFSRVFKKLKGVSPRVYRSDH